MLPDFAKLVKSSFSSVHKTPSLPAHQQPPFYTCKPRRRRAGLGAEEVAGEGLLVLGIWAQSCLPKSTVSGNKAAHCSTWLIILGESCRSSDSLPQSFSGAGEIDQRWLSWSGLLCWALRLRHTDSGGTSVTWDSLKVKRFGFQGRFWVTPSVENKSSSPWSVF